MLGAIYVVSAAIAGGLVLTRPSLILRPSVWFCAAMLLQINGAAAFADECLGYGPIDWGYVHAGQVRLAAVLFPLGIFAYVVATPRISAVASDLNRGCRESDRGLGHSGKPETSTILLLGFAAIVILAAYLMTVPAMSTGLAAILTDPASAQVAREKSLKLLDSTSLRYAYSLHCCLVVPFLVSLLWIAKSRGWAVQLFRWVLILGLFVSVMLTGARGPAGVLLVVLGVTCVLRKGVFRGGGLLAGTVFGALAIVLLLSAARAGQLDDLTFEQVSALIPRIASRACVAPFLTGMWTNLYSHENGLLGISNIRPLALLMGVQHVNLPNLVALAYSPHAIPSSSANTCFLFDLQASFGLIGGWIVALVLLGALDFLLYAFRPLQGGVLVAALAVFLTANLSLISSAFSVSLLTHGILPSAAVAMALSHYHRRSFKLREQYRRLCGLKIRFSGAVGSSRLIQGDSSCASST
jgi:hypothetical protein